MARPRGRPFTPGDPRINRAGRGSPSAVLTDALRALAGKSAGAGKTHAQTLAAVLWQRAEAGDMRAAALIADRLEGRPGQRVEVASDGDLHTSITYVGCGDSLSEVAMAMSGRQIVYSGVTPPSQADKLSDVPASPKSGNGATGDGKPE